LQKWLISKSMPSTHVGKKKKEGKERKGIYCAGICPGETTWTYWLNSLMITIKSEEQEHQCLTTPENSVTQRKTC